MNQNHINREEIIHECFNIMNQLKEKYDWDIMIKNSADQMGIDVKELEKAVIESDLYKWDKETKQYILK